MSFIHDTVFGYCAQNPKDTISYTWYASMTLVFIAFICITVAASRISTEGTNGAIGFAGVWTVLLMIALSAGGFVVLRKYRTPLAVGFFLGCVIMMSQQCLIIFAVFAGRSHTTTLDIEVSADNAVACFMFFLFLVYGFFAAVLAYFRKDLMNFEAQHLDGGNQGPPIGL